MWKDGYTIEKWFFKGGVPKRLAFGTGLRGNEDFKKGIGFGSVDDSSIFLCFCFLFLNRLPSLFIVIVMHAPVTLVAS